MQAKIKWLYHVIAITLVSVLFCSSVSAVEFVHAVQHEIVVATEFPLEIVVKNDVDPSVTEEIGKTISIRTISEFQNFQKTSLKIADYETNEVVYSNLITSSELVEVPSIKVDHTYSIYVMIYHDTDYKEYEGEFSLFLNDNTETYDISLNYECLSENKLTEYIKLDENGNVPELTDEQYNEIYSKLEIPSFINEEDAKKAKHIQRLEEFNDSYDTIGFRNADGTNTVYLFSSPVRYKDKSGKIKDAETDLKETSEEYKDQGFSYYNKFGELESYFADSLSDSKGIKVKKNSLEFEFGFSVGDNKKNFFEEVVSNVVGIFSQKDNKATLKEDAKQQKLEYKKANNKQNEIESEPTINGAKQTLVLEEAPEGNKVIFWVNSKGLTAKKNENNSAVEFVDEENNLQFTVGNIDLKDSYTGANEENATHFSINNTVSIVEQSDDRTLVEVALDEEMLNSPLSEYPMNVTMYATAATELSEVGYSYFDDRTVYNDGTQGNAGDQYLIVGQNGTYYDSVTCTYEPREGVSLMKYDLCSFTSINPADISKVELVLHEGSGNSSGVTVNLKRVTSNWSETSVTSSYINLVDDYYSGNACKYMNTSQSSLEHVFDITKMATDHLISTKGLSGGVNNYGFQLRTYASAPGKHFFSSDHSTIAYRPKLVINYATSQTPADLGLSTSKVYLLKNLSTSKYLSVANGHQVDGTTVKQETRTYDTSMYWKLEYLSDTGEYRFIPMNATGSRLDVITSSNTNGADVGIYNNGGYLSSNWKIVKNGTNNYSILSSVSYGTKGLKSNGNNIVIYDSSSDDHWQFIEATCDGTSANYVDTHVFDLYQPDSSTIKYKCIICGKELNTPEYDDRNILDDADYMTVYTLQQLYEYEIANKDYLKAEGCLKTIDKIRQRNSYKENGVSKYQYRNSSGTYTTPNDYEYSSSSVRLNISTNQITMGGFLLNSLFVSLFKNAADIVLQPFDNLSDIYDDIVYITDVVQHIGDKDEYALAEIRSASINWIATKAIGALEGAPGKVGKLTRKFSKVILVAGILADTYHIARDQTRLPGNYAIQVDIYTSSGIDTFIGDYGYKYYNGSYSPSKHMKNIINEYFDPWDNGVYDPITTPIYGHAVISYSGLQYSGGASKANDDFLI